MIKTHFHNYLSKIMRSKKGKALDLACGKGDYSKLLSKNGWSVDAVDLDSSCTILKKNKGINFIEFDLENLDYLNLLTSLHFKKYDLILLFRFLHRPLFNFLPKVLNKKGIIFCENFMIRGGKGKLRNKNFMYKSSELTRTNLKKIKLTRFWQGVSKKKDCIQSAVFQKL